MLSAGLITWLTAASISSLTMKAGVPIVSRPNAAVVSAVTSDKSTGATALIVNRHVQTTRLESTIKEDQILGPVWGNGTACKQAKKTRRFVLIDVT